MAHSYFWKWKNAIENSLEEMNRNRRLKTEMLKSDIEARKKLDEQMLKSKIAHDKMLDEHFKELLNISVKE